MLVCYDTVLCKTVCLLMWCSLTSEMTAGSVTPPVALLCSPCKATPAVEAGYVVIEELSSVHNAINETKRRSVTSPLRS